MEEVKKKAEMIRRSKVLKFYQYHANVYEKMVESGASAAYLNGYASMLNSLMDEFEITSDELIK